MARVKSGRVIEVASSRPENNLSSAEKGERREGGAALTESPVRSDMGKESPRHIFRTSRNASILGYSGFEALIKSRLFWTFAGKKRSTEVMLN